MECASEGEVEVFIEPQLPEPLLAIVGESPTAGALADLAARIGWRVRREVDPAADAVVVASMGHGDEDALAHAGVRNLEMPVTSDKVWQALAEAGLAE